MTPRKCRATSGAIRARVYPLLAACVERGIEWGLAHARKHGKPTDGQLKDHLERDIMSEICEAFAIEEDPEQ